MGPGEWDQVRPGVYDFGLCAGTYACYAASIQSRCTPTYVETVSSPSHYRWPLLKVQTRVNVVGVSLTLCLTVAVQH